MNEQESKCLDAVLRYLADHEGVRSNKLWSPEENASLADVDRRVELVAECNGRNFAFEHTLLEPYEGHKKHGIVTKLAESELRAFLSTTPFPFGIDVALPSRWVERIDSKKKRNQFIKGVAELVQREIAAICLLQDDEKFLKLGTVNSIEIMIVRNGFENLEKQELQPCLTLLADDYRAKRPDRIRRALADKIPKLSSWGKTHETVLILENQDISLTGFHSILPILQTEWNDLGNLPIDYVFVIDTSLRTWWLYPLIERKNWSWARANGLVRSFQFDEAELKGKLTC